MALLVAPVTMEWSFPWVDRPGTHRKKGFHHIPIPCLAPSSTSHLSQSGQPHPGFEFPQAYIQFHHCFVPVSQTGGESLYTQACLSSRSKPMWNWYIRSQVLSLPASFLNSFMYSLADLPHCFNATNSPSATWVRASSSKRLHNASRKRPRFISS